MAFTLSDTVAPSRMALLAYPVKTVMYINDYLSVPSAWPACLSNLVHPHPVLLMLGRERGAWMATMQSMETASKEHTSL
jgi:hypothetical protein